MHNAVWDMLVRQAAVNEIAHRDIISRSLCPPARLLFLSSMRRYSLSPTVAAPAIEESRWCLDGASHLMSQHTLTIVST